MASKHKVFLENNNICYIVRDGNMRTNINKLGDSNNYIKIATGIQYGNVYILQNVKGKHFLINSIECDRLMFSMNMNVEMAVMLGLIYPYNDEMYKIQCSKNAKRRVKVAKNRDSKIEKGSTMGEWANKTKLSLEDRRPIYESILQTSLEDRGLIVLMQEPFNIQGNIFFADLYIKSKKAIIELDGGYHLTSEQKEKDKNRDSLFRSIGIRTFRISNDKAVNPTERRKFVDKIVNYNKK